MRGRLGDKSSIAAGRARSLKVVEEARRHYNGFCPRPRRSRVVADGVAFPSPDVSRDLRGVELTRCIHAMGELHHECGVAAVYHAAAQPVSPLAPIPGDRNSVARLIPRMLLDMQNRGQLAAGMTSYHPGPQCAA